MYIPFPRAQTKPFRSSMLHRRLPNHGHDSSPEHRQADRESITKSSALDQAGITAGQKGAPLLGCLVQVDFASGYEKLDNDGLTICLLQTAPFPRD